MKRKTNKHEEKQDEKIQLKMKKKTKMKETSFLFRNNIIVIFTSCESLILGDSRHIYIAGEILSVFFPVYWGKYTGGWKIGQFLLRNVLLRKTGETFLKRVPVNDFLIMILEKFFMR